MFGKIVAGLVMGLIAAFLGFIIFALMVGGGEEGAGTGLWGIYLGFAAALILAVTARTGKRAWGRGMVLNGLLCFTAPIAGFVFSVVTTTGAIGEASPGAETVGTVIGAGLAGGVVTGILGFLGFFAALIFLIPSYFLLRDRTP